VSVDVLAVARAAIAEADWQRAYDAAMVAEAVAERDAIIADALWWLGRIEECIERREAAFRAFELAGDSRDAGQCAVWLYEHYCFRGRPAMASAWLQRARRALDGDTECAAYGALVLREAEAAHGRGQLDDALAAGRDTLVLARRLRSTDLEAESLQTIARVLIDQGRTDDGLAHLDEAMLFAIEGRLSPYTTGKVYCSLISACEELGDLRRAAEWTDATARWAQDHPFAFFPGICRVHRASALGWRGHLELAEREAEQACTELVAIHLPNAAAAYAEVGDIRRRLGDLDGSETAFAKAEELSGRGCSGLALLRLAQGRIDAATRVIDDCLDEATWNRLARARVLPGHAQISIAAGALDAARASADELDAIATTYATDVLQAAAATTRGRVLLADGDVRAAAARLRDALAIWKALDVPYEVATTGTLLAQALRESGDEAGANAAFAAAESVFEQIGARLDARRARNTHGDEPAPGGLSRREIEVLKLVAAGYGNKAIAGELFLSEKTVSRHLSNIFAKIGVSSRAAATAYAFEHGIVGRN
jgi:ATP/maltotriose-dependent transcriptional regulator MalT